MSEDRHDEQRQGPTRAAAALAGVLAGGAVLGTAELVAALVNPLAAPVVAVGDAFVDLTPPWLKDFAVETFGTADKLVLLVGIGVVVTALSALSGLLALRSRALGALVPALLVAVAVVAALTRPAAAPLDALPGLAGGAVGIPVLLALVDRVRRVRHDARAGRSPDGARRGFLVGSLAAGSAAVLAAVAGRLLGRGAGGVVAAREDLALPPADDAAVPVTEAVSVDVEGMPPWQTPNPEFYRIDTALVVPRVAPQDWRLRVHGMVEQELELSFDDLLDREVLERWITLVCVSNQVGGELAGNALWRGASLRDVIAEAGPDPAADMVLSTSADGFTASTPTAVVLDSPDALLAYAMNDQPLPLEHGFPVRMVVPGLYGYVSATKWVVDLELTTYERDQAYWTPRGYSARAPIKLSSRIDVPRSFAEVPAGPTAVAGTAWAPATGISRVEVRVDGGPWAEAELAAVPTTSTWRQWLWEWDATPGQHLLEARAVDADGDVQVEERSDPLPDGSTGWHSVAVRVV